MKVTVDITGIEDLLAVLGRVDEALDPERMLDEAGAILLNRIRTRFLAEEDPDGNPWEPSAAGIKRRAGGYTYRAGKRYTGTGTLFESGALFHSIQLYRSGAAERAIGTDVPYGLPLQEGTDNMPPRVFLGFGDDDVATVERLIVSRIERAIG